MSVLEEVFVGRAKEIEQFFDFLKKRGCPTFVVIGEPGIGKSSFMKEVAGRLAGDEKFVVGFYDVPFSADIANPFVGVLEKLVDDLAARSKGQVKSVLKRIVEAGRKVAIKRGDRIARAFLKDLLTKLGGKHVVEELVEFKSELDETPTIYSLADEFVRQHKSEFIYDFQEFFEELVKEFPDKEFVLLIDQFERAPMPSCDVFLDLVRGRHENVHMAVALKVEEKGSERFNYVKPHLEQIGAEIVELRALTIEEIGEWMRSLGKNFSYLELKKIWELSAGFSFAISEWLKTSKECDLRMFEIIRGKYCNFVKWRIDGLKDECKLMLRSLSILLKPLSVEDYERLAGIETGSCGLFLKELIDKWILDKYDGTFWFRHELIRCCIEQDLTESEKKKYHLTAAQFFQKKYNEARIANKKVDFDVRYGCAYHWHFSRKSKESLEHNMQLADFCFDIAELDLAEDCCLRAIDDAEALGEDSFKIVAKGKLASIYHIWGRLDEAFRTNIEVLKYSRKIGDHSNEAVALRQLGAIEAEKGNYEKAIELYRQSLDTYTRLGDQSGIANSFLSLSGICRARDEYDEATNLLQKSLKIFRKFRDQSGIAKTLDNLATIYYLKGEYDKATKLLRQSLNIRRKLGYQRGAAYALYNLAVIYRARGEYDEAAKLLQQSLNIKKKLGDQSGIALAILGIGEIYRDRGEFDEAIKLCKESLNTFQKLENQGGIALALHCLATIYRGRNEFDEAINLLQQSLEIKKKLGDQREIALSYEQLGLIYENLDKLAIAADYYLKALNIFQKIRDKLNATKAKTGYERVTKQKKQ